MAAISSIGLGLAAVGIGTKIFGAFMENDANQAAIAAQQQAEKVKLAQAKLNAERDRREAIRKGTILHSQALAAATAQGAGASSALEGSYGQVSQETSWRVAGVNEAEKTAVDTYKANQALLAAKQQIADAQTIESIGGGLSSLGGGLVGNADTIDRAWGSLFASDSSGATKGVSGISA